MIWLNIYHISNEINNTNHLIDLSKAFDTLDHTILSQKLNHYGISGIANDWFSSYLVNRKEYVNLGSVCPESCNATRLNFRPSFVSCIYIYIYIYIYTYMYIIYIYIYILWFSKHI